MNEFCMENKINVLEVVGEPVGGIRKHVHSIIENIDKSKFVIGYVYSNVNSDTTFKKEIHTTAKFLKFQQGFKIYKKPHINDLINILKIIILVYKNQVSILHGHGAKGGLYARIAGVICGKKVIYTPHGGSVHSMYSGLEEWLYTATEKILFYATDYFIFESNYSKSQYKRKIGREFNNWIVNYNGINSDAITHNGDYKTQLDKDKYNVGVFGVLREQKGQQYAIQAMTYLNDNNVVLHIFGDGEDKQKLRKMTDDLNLKGRVKYYGDITNPQEFMRDLNLVVIPSLFESFGYVAIEAYSLKIPLVCTKVGGLEEVVDDNTGIIIEPKDSRSLADAVIYSMNNPDILFKKAQQGYERFRKNYTLDMMINNLSNIYRKII